MNTLIGRIVFCVAGALSALLAVPVAHGEVPIFYGGYTKLAPVAQGSYVDWIRQLPPFRFERLPDLTVGQVWEIDGMNHQVQYFDVYRAFLVFDVPRYKGIVTREEIGIPDWAVPEVTELRTKVLDARIGFGKILLEEFSADYNPIEVRWSSLSASGLLDGSIDPEAAFNGLITGPRVEAEDSRLYISDTPTGVRLNDSFIDFLKNTDGGPVVFSFTMPLYDKRGAADLKYLMPEISLNITYDGYAPMSPVPEPATYACTGAAVCLAMAIRRAAKSGKLRLNKIQG